jgi:hypothetical protein
MLGAEAEPCFTDHQQTLAPGDVLLALTDPPAPSGPEPQGFDANGVAEALLRQTHLSARQIAEKGRDLLVSAAESGPRGNPAVLVVRRDEQTAT